MMTQRCSNQQVMIIILSCIMCTFIVNLSCSIQILYVSSSFVSKCEINLSVNTVELQIFGKQYFREFRDPFFITKILIRKIIN